MSGDLHSSSHLNLSRSWSQVRYSMAASTKTIDVTAAMAAVKVAANGNALNLACNISGINFSAAATAVLNVAFAKHGLQYTTNTVHYSQTRNSTGRLKSVTKISDYEETSYTNVGSHKFVFNDPPPIEAVLNYFDIKDRSLVNWKPAGTSDSPWIALNDQFLRQSGVDAHFDKSPEWKRNREKIIKFKENYEKMKGRMPGDASHSPEFQSAPVNWRNVKARNAAVRIEVGAGARQSITVYSDHLSGLTFGGRTAYHYGAQRDVYLKSYKSTAEEFGLLVMGKSIQHFRGLPTRKDVDEKRSSEGSSPIEYRYEQPMKMAGVLCIPYCTHPIIETARILLDPGGDSTGSRSGIFLEAHSIIMRPQAPAEPDQVRPRVETLEDFRGLQMEFDQTLIQNKNLELTAKDSTIVNSRTVTINVENSFSITSQAGIYSYSQRVNFN